MGQPKMRVSVFQKAKQGNIYCGDSFYYHETENQFICVLADGLGSGKYALESSQAVIDIIKDNNDIGVEEFIRESNEILFGKRGVVLGILKINFNSNSYSFSSIGNIGMVTVIDGKIKNRNIPISGYLAGYKRPMKVENYKLEKGTTFFMYSDGITNRELSQCCFYYKDVNYITKAFELISGENRKDDTTFIAMRYEG